jgi:hypothetical protein
VVEELRQRTVDLVGNEVALPELADRGARGVEGGLAAALLGRAAQPRRGAGLPGDPQGGEPVLVFGAAAAETI